MKKEKGAKKDNKIVISIQGSLVGVTPVIRDKSIGLKFKTREREVGEIEKWAAFGGFEGTIAFAPNNFQDFEMPKEEAYQANPKGSPSKQLRDTLYVYFHKNPELAGGKEDFELWYYNTLMKWKQNILDKINALEI